jgi:Mn2+/Fe2+ NRAMP family transporter
VTGAADDDPAGIGTYSQVGAAFRFDLVWTALVSLPLASAVQETAARLGLTSGRGLMSLIKEHFARPVLWLAAALVVGANVFNIGADLGSMAEAFRLLIPVPFAVLVVGMAGTILLLEIFVSYDRYSLILRWLALSIFAYVLELFVVDVNWSQVAAGLIPGFQPTLASVEALVAIFGTTISPYLFVWQAGEEVEERKAGRIGRVDASADPRDARRCRVRHVGGRARDVRDHGELGATLGANGSRTSRPPPRPPGPRTDRGSVRLRAVRRRHRRHGPARDPDARGFGGVRAGRDVRLARGAGRKLKEAPGFYGVLAAAIAIGLGLNFVGIDPIRALYVSAILNGLAAPPLILLMLILSRSRRAELRTGRLSDGLMVIALLVMSASAAVYLIGSLVG